MSSPDLTAHEITAVQQVLTTNILTIGPQIQAFERAIASYVGVAHAIGVNSGTSGLHLCVIAAGVSDGDAVITTPFSFIASANAILYERGIPVFVDVDERTGNIDANLVAEAGHDLARGKVDRWLPRKARMSKGRVKAVMPVHALGQPVDMNPILATAKENGLFIIEDACESIGAEYKGCQTGKLGDAAVFAFYPNKQMTTGEGGMIVTDRDDWANLFRSLRNQGRDVFDAWLNHTRLGYNYRLDEMSSALGLAQVNRIDELLSKRATVTGWYNEKLMSLEAKGHVQLPFVDADVTKKSWFVYVIRVRPCNDTLSAPAYERRNRVMQELEKVGIPSRPYFTPIHLQPFYRERFGYERGDFPVTEFLGDVSLALPFSSVMSEQQVDYVTHHLQRILCEA